MKALWTIFAIVLPFLGVFFYLITQGQGIGERAQRQAQAVQVQFDAQLKAAGAGGPAAEIDKAKQLLDRGAVTQAEFDAIKTDALATPAS